MFNPCIVESPWHHRHLISLLNEVYEIAIADREHTMLPGIILRLLD